MGLFSTQKYFLDIFAIFVITKMENLTHSFLDMVGMSQKRACPKDG